MLKGTSGQIDSDSNTVRLNLGDDFDKNPIERLCMHGDSGQNEDPHCETYYL